MGNRDFKNLVSWHHLLCAPLLFSFQQVIIINPALSKDAVSTVENPAFFFAGYLAMSLIVCLACAWPQTRMLIKKVPTVAALLVLVLGMLAAYAHVLLEMGSPTIRLIAGACTGLAGSIIFLKWCSMLAHLKITVLARTTALAFTIAYAMALVSSCFLRSVEGSLTSMLVAIFISALPLEALQKRDCQSADSVSSSPNFDASNVRSLLTGWWPFLAATFVTYAITGFSWGNALFNEFDYFVLGPSWLNPAGSFLGAFIIFVATVKNETHSIPRWPLPICVGLLLSSWLLFVTFGQNATDLTVPLTGVAFGMLDPLLLAWACAVPRSHGVDPLISAAFGRGASLIPIALGILLAPLLKSAAATLVSPLAGVAFFVAYRFDSATPKNTVDGAGASLLDDANLLEKFAGTAGLSSREYDVFVLLSHGYSSGYIAEHLGVSRCTVKTHLKHIYAKLDVHTKDEFLDLIAEIAPAN